VRGLPLSGNSSSTSCSRRIMAAVDCVLCGETSGISVGGGGTPPAHTYFLSAQSNCLSLHRTPLCCHLPAKHVRAHTPPAPHTYL